MNIAARSPWDGYQPEEAAMILGSEENPILTSQKILPTNMEMAPVYYAISQLKNMFGIVRWRQLTG